MLCPLLMVSSIITVGNIHLKWHPIISKYKYTFILSTTKNFLPSSTTLPSSSSLLSWAYCLLHLFIVPYEYFHKEKSFISISFSCDLCVCLFSVFIFLGLVFLVYGLVFMLFLFSAVFAHDHFSGLNLTLRKTAEKTN